MDKSFMQQRKSPLGRGTLKKLWQKGKKTNFFPFKDSQGHPDAKDQNTKGRQAWEIYSRNIDWRKIDLCAGYFCKWIACGTVHDR
jgi:hypothetical protein